MLVDGNDAIVDDLVARDHNHEDSMPGERDQLDLIEGLAGSGDGSSDADAAGHLGEHMGRALNAAFHGVHLAELAAEAVQFTDEEPAAG